MSSYKVLFDYATDNKEEELGLKQDEIITVTETNDTGWWKASNAQGKSGWVPSNYLTPFEDPDKPKKVEKSERKGKKKESGGDGDDRVCHSCKEVISGDFVVAKDKHFHVDHFTCCVCKTTLTGKHFAVEDDEFYCIDDYHEKFSPKCARCLQPIRGKYVTALEQTWHPEHFTCVKCNAPFAENRFRKKDSTPYCEDCYQLEFGVKCYKCDKPILGKVFDAFGKQCHLECFVCEVDGAPIGEGAPFHIHEDKVYCPQHFEDIFLQKCNLCKEPIRDQFVQVLDFHYHPDCWKCANCDASLGDGSFEQYKDSFVCRSCFNTLKEADKNPAPVKEEEPEKEKGPRVIEIKSKAAPAPAVPKAAVVVAQSDDEDEIDTEEKAPADGSVSYTFEQLKEKDTLPSSVQRNMLERYLSPKEFQQVFKMSLREFQALRPWRQAQLKRAAGLF